MSQEASTKKPSAFSDLLNRLDKFLYLVVLAWLGWFIWPASYWFEVDHVFIEDFEKGAEAEIVFDRSINRNFEGSFATFIKSGDGSKTICPHDSAKFEYKKTSNLPDKITFDWWFHNSCDSQSLPAGDYLIDTEWTLHFGILTKDVSQRSNIFRVYPKREQDKAEDIQFEILDLQKRIDHLTKELQSK